MNVQDCYKLLDVSEGASEEQIKQAYRILVKVWHPDRFQHDPRLQKKAVEKLKEINNAYAVLLEASKNNQKHHKRQTEDSASHGQKQKEKTRERSHEKASEHSDGQAAGQQNFWWICPSCLARNLSITLKCRCGLQAEDNLLYAFAESRTAADLYNLAWSCRKKGQNKTAIFFARYLIRRYPDSPEAAEFMQSKAKSSASKDTYTTFTQRLNKDWAPFIYLKKSVIGVVVLLLLVSIIQETSDKKSRLKPDLSLPPLQEKNIEPEQNVSKRVLPKPAIGYAPFGKGVYGGHSTLTVENGADTDALVKVVLTGNKNRMVRNFYVPSNEKYTAKSLPRGRYILKVAYGLNWDNREKRFSNLQLFSISDPFELKEVHDIVESGEYERERIRYSNVSVNLHKVIGGNFKTRDIDENQFATD